MLTFEVGGKLGGLIEIKHCSRDIPFNIYLQIEFGIISGNPIKVIKKSNQCRTLEIN